MSTTIHLVDGSGVTVADDLGDVYDRVVSAGDAPLLEVHNEASDEREFVNPRYIVRVVQTSGDGVID